MKRIIFLIAVTTAFSMNAFAHTAFTLVSSQKKTVKESEVASLDKQQTAGTKQNTTITFTGREINLVAITGPEDDMLSYRIQGIRNPNLVVPSGVTLRILFINIDHDMRHDIRF